MTTIRDTKRMIVADPENWVMHLMNFVDDFRRSGDLGLLREEFEGPHDRIAALLASTAESLCDEQDLEVPEWLSKVPGLKEPYFVSGLEDLKAISLVESPLRFRIRKIFVLENFLYRA